MAFIYFYIKILIQTWMKQRRLLLSWTTSPRLTSKRFTITTLMGKKLELSVLDTWGAGAGGGGGCGRQAKKWILFHCSVYLSKKYCTMSDQYLTTDIAVRFQLSCRQALCQGPCRGRGRGNQGQKSLRAFFHAPLQIYYYGRPVTIEATPTQIQVCNIG